MQELFEQRLLSILSKYLRAIVELQHPRKPGHIRRVLNFEFLRTINNPNCKYTGGWFLLLNHVHLTGSLIETAIEPRGSSSMEFKFKESVSIASRLVAAIFYTIGLRLLRKWIADNRIRVQPFILPAHVSRAAK